MRTNPVRLVTTLMIVGLAASAAALGVPVARGGAEGTALQPGPKIAFIRQDPSSPYAAHIFVMNPDGSGLRQLTNGEYSDSNETWSPNRSRILFERSTWSGSSHKSDIYVVGADGSG